MSVLTYQQARFGGRRSHRSQTERFLNQLFQSDTIEFANEIWNDPDDIDTIWRCSLCAMELNDRRVSVEDHCKLHLGKLAAESTLVAAAWAAWIGGDIILAEELCGEATKIGFQPCSSHVMEVKP